MANVTLQQLIQDAKNAGFTGQGLTNIVAISEAEDTSGNPLATNTVGNSAGTDRGVLQINSFYHPEVSNQCAFDPQCSFNAAFNISSSGTNFTPWATFTSGKYLQYVNDVMDPGTNSNTGTVSLPSASSIGTSLQTFGIQSLFVVGGAAIIIMGLFLIFKPKKTLPA
jgi:hypothetical protein